jgi:flavin reductase (DIM6/NTAB) family NADH-FMN oxidoreductase RutF
MSAVSPALDVDLTEAGHPDRVSPAAMRTVLGGFPTGVTALAAMHRSKPIGLAASSFTSVSLDPPLVSVCIGRSSTTWPLLSSCPRIGVSVLGADHGPACRQLSARGIDRFSGLDWRASDGGAVFLADVSAWLECSVDRQIDVGDHDIVVLRVHDLALLAHVAPLVFHGSRFTRLDPTDRAPA